MRFVKILLVIGAAAFLFGVTAAGIDGGAPLPIPPRVADGGAPLPIPPALVDGRAPLPIPPASA